MYTNIGFFVITILIYPEFRHLETYLNKTGRRISYAHFKKGNSTEPTINVAGENEHWKKQKERFGPSRKGRVLLEPPFPCFGKYHKCQSFFSLEKCYSSSNAFQLSLQNVPLLELSRTKLLITRFIANIYFENLYKWQRKPPISSKYNVQLILLQCSLLGTNKGPGENLTSRLESHSPKKLPLICLSLSMSHL